MIPRVFIIEDEPALSAALETALRRIGCAVETVASGKAALQWLKTNTYAVVVLDIGLPDMSGLQVLKELRKRDAAVPVLVITAHGHLDNAIAASTAGATDYLVKPLDLRHFQQTVRALLEQESPAKLAATNETTRSQIFVGGATTLQAAFAAIARACAGTGPVLISGPSGSGKSLAAKIIHEQCSRSGAALETISSAGLTNDALTELLKPSPTQGTVVLDEICQLPSAGQLHLVNLLGSGAATRRVIATTSQDLREAATDGRFREDLYYLLSVGEVPLPALRDRSSDIPALAASLLARGGATAPEMTPSALAALQEYDWPGNVRELTHVLEYAATASQGRPILLSHLPPHVGGRLPCTAQPSSLDQALHDWLAETLAVAPDSTYEELLDQLERSLLGRLLPRYENKPTRLATALKLHRSTLRQKMQRLGLSEES